MYDARMSGDASGEQVMLKIVSILAIVLAIVGVLLLIMLGVDRPNPNVDEPDVQAEPDAS
jgi:hypothetical protein